MSLESNSQTNDQPNYRPTIVDLLRHSELKTSGLFCADQNEKLSSKGLQQLATATDNHQWDIIVSSPYARCREYAERLAKQKSCELLIIDNFKEMDFGRWIGVEQATIWKQDSTLLKQLWDDPESFIAPSGESMRAFGDRVQHGWQEILTNYKEQSILLITHAGVIRCILAHTLSIPYKSTQAFKIGYAKYTRLHCYSSDLGHSNQVYSLVKHGT